MSARKKRWFLVQLECDPVGDYWIVTKGAHVTVNGKHWAGRGKPTLKGALKCAPERIGKKWSEYHRLRRAWFVSSYLKGVRTMVHMKGNRFAFIYTDRFPKEFRIKNSPEYIPLYDEGDEHGV